MGRIPVVRLLLLLIALALLCAAPVSAWAVPTVDGYKIRLLTGVRSDTAFSSPYTFWAHEVNLRIRDDAGAASITGVTVTWNPSGGPLPDHTWEVRTDDPTTYEFLTPTGDGQSICLSTVWAELAQPIGGSYTVVAHSTSGDSRSITTAPITHWPEPGLLGDGSAWGLGYPALGSIIPESDTQPLLSWPAYPGFACEGSAPADGQSLGVFGFDGTCQWRNCGLDPSATAIAYGTGGGIFSLSLEPGRSYAVNLGESRAPVWLGGDPGGCLEETVRVASPFTVYSPVPAIQSSDIWRWRCLCPDPGNVESLCEGARVSVLDFDGWQDVSVITQTPDGLQLPDPLGWDCSTNEGSYVLSQTSGHNAPGLNSGSYTITAGDAAGATVSLVSGQVTQVPPLHRITSPSNGAVLAETELTPTFSWEGAPGAAFTCVCVKDRGASDAVIWVKRNIPGDIASVVYNDDGQGQPLVPGGRYLVVVRVHYPDEDADDGVGIDTLTGAAANFSTYSPPAISHAAINRGRDMDACGQVCYHQEAQVLLVGIADPAAVAVTVTAPGDNEPHPASFKCQPDAQTVAFCWQSCGHPTPLPPGTYTVTMADSAGHTDSVRVEVSEIPEYTPVLQVPAGGSVTTSTPNFLWSGPADVCYCLGVGVPNGACRLWCGGRSVAGSTGAATYNDNGTAPSLTPGGCYRWGVRATVPDLPQSDPRASSNFTPRAFARFWVEPKFVGFLEPVNDNGSSLFRLGSVVPVKFHLVKADGSQVTDATCELHLAKVTDDVTGTELEVVSAGAADSGSTFRYATDHYQFNLNTKVLSTGTYRLWVTISGATVHEATFSLQ